MLPRCSKCHTGAPCKEHPRFSGESLFDPSSAGLIPRPPAIASKLPKSFVFFQPSHPTTLSRPLHEHTREEIANVAAASSAQKRKPCDEAEASSSQASKRSCPSPVSILTALAPSSGPTPVLRSHAYDVWESVRGCDSDKLGDPAGVEQIKQQDSAYQKSQPLERFRRPLDQRLRCIHCLRDRNEWKTWLNRDGGVTSRIRAHMLKHHPEEFQARRDLPLKGANDDLDDEDIEFSPELLTQCIAQWIAVDDQSMNVVESREFRRMILAASHASSLQNQDNPHRKKVSQAAEDLFETEKDRMKQALQNALGRISLTSDLWSDDMLRAFMAVTVHYIDHNGELAEHLVAFRRLKGQHTGANLGKVLFSIIKEFGITNKIGHITLDNASSNDTLMKELEDVFKACGLVFGRDFNRIRCFPHVINLAVGVILKSLADSAERFRDENAAQGYELDEDVTDYLAALSSGLVGACRESIKSLRSSDLRREGLSETIREGNLHGWFSDEAGPLILPVLQLLRDSETRWSSTYNMISRYIQLYPAILRFTSMHPAMKIPVMTSKQCEVLQDLVSVLSILHSAQELLSAERTPTLALALPVYEALIQALQESIDKFPELQYAIESGIRKLESYVAKARDLPVYALAMAINPCIRFNWIDTHWSRSQRQGARVVVKEKMLKVRQEQHKLEKKSTNRVLSSAERAARAQNSGYMRLLSVSDRIGRASEQTPGAPSTSSLPPPLPSPPALSADELLTRHMAEVDAELLRWESLRGYDLDTMGTISLVDFWKTRRFEFPLLYAIAMDILPVQASSVSSERAFSSGKMTCTRERNRISGDSMEILQVLKHSLHRRRSTNENNQTLDFMAHVVGSESDEE